MKKTISLVLVILMLGILCLPVYAESKSVERILYEAEIKTDAYVHRFERNCLSIPATLSPVIFVDTTIEIDGEAVYFESTLDSDKTTFSSDDTLIIFPKEEEYAEPIFIALTDNFPFLMVDKTESTETSGTIIAVSLPKMTKDMRDVCEKLLNTYATNTSMYINLLKSATEGKLIKAGGSDVDKAALDAICDDAVSRMKDIRDEYAGYINARRDLYLDEHPEDEDEGDAKTGTMLSEGNLLILCTVMAAVVFGVGGFVLGRKKKTALSNSKMVDNEE